jgi:hypothetical protein
MIARCRRRHERHADPEKTLELQFFEGHDANEATHQSTNQDRG